MIEVYAELTGESGSGIRYVKQEDVYGTSYEDIPRRVPDNRRMREILKVEPEVDLREGLRRTMKWFLEEEAARGNAGERVVSPEVARRATVRPGASVPSARSG
jgi:hypothetical protein